MVRTWNLKGICTISINSFVRWKQLKELKDCSLFITSYGIFVDSLRPAFINISTTIEVFEAISSINYTTYCSDCTVAFLPLTSNLTAFVLVQGRYTDGGNMRLHSANSFGTGYPYGTVRVPMDSGREHAWCQCVWDELTLCHSNSMWCPATVLSQLL